MDTVTPILLLFMATLLTPSWTTKTELLDLGLDIQDILLTNLGLEQKIYSYSTHCLKITQNVAFEFWHFPPIFVQLKLTCLVTLFDRKL